MTERIREFLRNRVEDGPCLVVDLDVVRENYSAFAKALPDTRVFYAVKANPAPGVLTSLAELGASFEVASPGETIYEPDGTLVPSAPVLLNAKDEAVV